MSTENYEKVRKFLHGLCATGMPKSESGAEIRILQKLFSPEEAEAVLYLRLGPEPVEVIAERMGRDPAEVGQLLKTMAEHCVIRAHPKGNAVHYEAMVWVPGIMEISLRNATEQYARDYMEYMASLRAAFDKTVEKPGPAQAPRIAYTRTIPVEESIAAGSKVLPHEHIAEIIEKAARPRAVQECWCRSIKEMAGGHCDKHATKEVCISFGAFAQNIIDAKAGREIDDAEFKAIMRTANEAGLVPLVALNTSSFTEILNLCNCCNCCCSSLSVKVANDGKNFGFGQAASGFIACIDEDICAGCTRYCMEGCQTAALYEENGISTLKTGRCIGCGLCVVACPQGAIALVRRKEEDLPQVASSMADLYEKSKRKKTHVA